MTYSVWADGERIGETRLELRPSPRRRTGAFMPDGGGPGIAADDHAPGSQCLRLAVRDPAGCPRPVGSVAITDRRVS